MKTKSKFNCLIIMLISVLALLAGVVAMSGCGAKIDPDLLLHLTFDEGSGTTVKDASKNQSDATVEYVFTDPEYMEEPQDPQWRTAGAVGGSLLFDGYSNRISYSNDELQVSGSALTVQAWVAPRMFEWDPPEAVEKGEEHLTAVVSQYNDSSNTGFILGYQRHGAWSFQVGVGDRYYRVWDDGHPLTKYEWNHIAATFDGENGEIKMYLNGELVNTQKTIKNAQIKGTSRRNLYIAYNNDPDSCATASYNMVSGLLDDIKLYKRALTESEIKSYYNSCNPAEIKFEDIWLQNILTTDIHKTQYHGGPYQHWMNEPHAPFYYNGKYHLFFQFNLNGPYFHNICWGHLVSDDMVNWKPLKEVITPTAETVCPDGVWSGGATLDSQGNPVLFFTAGDDARTGASDLIGNQNIGMARPKDLSDPELKEWVVSDEYAIKQKSGQGKAGEFRDAFVYRDGENGDYTWYMLICSSNKANKGTALIYTTKDDRFNNWTYKGEVYQMPANIAASYGRTWELPVLVPIETQDGTQSKWVFVFSPAPADEYDASIFYLLGDFDKTTCKFTPDDPNPRKFDFGQTVFTGPSALIDPITGKVTLYSIMQDQRGPGEQAKAGWAHCVGLTREVYLSDDGKTACIKAIDELKDYESKVLAESNEQLTIAQANSLLSDVKGDMLHVEVTFKLTQSALSGDGLFGVYLRAAQDKSQYTEYGYNLKTSTLYVSTGMSGNINKSGTGDTQYSIKNDTVKMEFYVDRSLIEGFFDDTVAGSARAYSKSTSNGVQLFGEDGIVVTHIKVSQMKSIY